MSVSAVYMHRGGTERLTRYRFGRTIRFELAEVERVEGKFWVLGLTEDKMGNKTEAPPAARTAGRADKKNLTVNPFITSADIFFGNDTSTEAIEQAKILMPDNEISLTLGLVVDCVARFEKIEAASDSELHLLGRAQVRDSVRYKNLAFLIRTRVA